MATLTTAQMITAQEGFLETAKANGNKKQAKTYRKSIKRLRADLKEEQNPEPVFVTLTGKIKNQSDKAIQMNVLECHDMPELQGTTMWLPKSQVEVMRGAMGPMDSVRCPEWLAKSKQS